MTDSKIITAKINGMEVKVPAGTSILDAAFSTNVKIPALCKHPDLHATAACGICVVKNRNSPNMMRACSTPLVEGMDIITHDPELVSVRRTVLELILSAHPNECLTCGRNGTCELQKLAETFGIRRQNLPELVPDLPKDDTTNALVLEPRKCIKCGRCIDVCQNMQNVWALSFLERGLETRISPAGDITLSESPCVKCGQCSAHCPVGAIYEHDETAPVWKALMDKDKYCIVQIAPAVRVSIGESFGYEPGVNLTGQIYHALRLLGFKTVFDTNFGADVTIMEEASEFVERFAHGEGKLPLITTCCPAWVDFMEKFHSDMIEHFSSCKSPHAIVGTLAKTYYAEKLGIDPSKIFMVSIMPCIAKKYEVDRNASMHASGFQDVDVSLTTREFIRMIKQAGIDLRSLNAAEEADSPLGEYTGAGTIFGASGGVMEAAIRTASYFITGKDSENLEINAVRGLSGIKTLEAEINGKTVRVAVAHGLKNVEDVLDSVRNAIKEGREVPYHFIEVMACPGGCVGGGGQAWRVSDEIRKKRAEGLYKDDRNSKKRCSHENESVKKLYAEYIGKPLSEKAEHLFHTSYTHRPLYKR